MISLINLYALQSLEGVGDTTIRKIISSKLAIGDLMDFTQNELRKYFSTEKAVDSFRNNFYNAQNGAEYEIEKYKANGIDIIHYFDNYYPKNLSRIEDFPIFLYCVGNKNLLLENNNIAVIGTRDNSEVGQQIAKNTAYYFAQNGYTIVSGLAKGIDGIAHTAALDANGNTIAVLIDVSKIQSGLSLAIFPIETDILGGTMHTVKYAKKQGRLIFVPDVFNDAIKQRYDNTVGNNFSKINGIKDLILKKDAFPYTKENYSEVQNKLQNLSGQIENQTLIELNSKNEVNKFELYDTSQNSNENSNELNIDNQLYTKGNLKRDDYYEPFESRSPIITSNVTEEESNFLYDPKVNTIFSKKDLEFVEIINHFKKEIDQLTNTKSAIVNNAKIICSNVEALNKKFKKLFKEKKGIITTDVTKEISKDLF